MSRTAKEHLSSGNAFGIPFLSWKGVAGILAVIAVVACFGAIAAFFVAMEDIRIGVIHPVMGTIYVGVPALIAALSIYGFRTILRQKIRTTATAQGAVVPETPDNGFAVSSDGDGSTVHFGINGSGIGGGAWFGAIVAGMIVGIPLSLSLGASGFVIATIALVGVAFIWDRFRKARYEFSVSDSTVQGPDGKLYARADISELLIRNAGGIAQAAPVQSSQFVVGVGVAGAAMVGAMALSNSANRMGSAIGSAISQSLGKRGNEVGIRYGRTVVPLAKYLREDDAVALFNAIREHL